LAGALDQARGHESAQATGPPALVLLLRDARDAPRGHQKPRDHYGLRFTRGTEGAALFCRLIE
jgi:hypothetical protein